MLNRGQRSLKQSDAVATYLLQRVTHHVISHLDKAPKTPQLSTPGCPKCVLELLCTVWMLQYQLLLSQSMFAMPSCMLQFIMLHLTVLLQHTTF